MNHNPRKFPRASGEHDGGGGGIFGWLGRAGKEVIYLGLLQFIESFWPSISAFLVGLAVTSAKKAYGLPVLYLEIGLGFFFLSILLIPASILLSRKSKSETQLNRFHDVSRVFSELAMQHAECDQKLFEQLGVFIAEDIEVRLKSAEQAITMVPNFSTAKTTIDELVNWGRHVSADRRVAIENAIGIVHRNIENTVTSTAKIISAFTGTECAACLKVLSPPQRNFSDIRHAPIITKYRDLGSRGNIHRSTRNGGEYEVGDNTITEIIMGEGKAVWGNDNLDKLTNYRNLRDEWRVDYNATLGAGVPALWKLPFPYWAVLCVDNLRGGLCDNPLCERFLQELAQRISVMLYRLDQLERRRETYARHS